MDEISNLESELATLPKGTIIRRTIRGIDRFYHQWREDGATKSRYLGPGEILPLRAQLERRKYILSILPKRVPFPAPTQTSQHSNIQTSLREPVPGDFRCDVMTGRLLTEYAAAVAALKTRDYFDDLRTYLHETAGDCPRFLVGHHGSGKTTTLRQLVSDLPTTHKAKAAYIRLTGVESAPDLTADLNLLRNLGFRFVFLDDADGLTALPGAGLTMILAGGTVPNALAHQVKSVDGSFIPFREFSRITGETNAEILVERGGILGTVPTTTLDPTLDRFVLDMLALAAVRAKDEAREHGETFLGTDIQKLWHRFSEISGMTGEDDMAVREALLNQPVGQRYRHACTQIELLLTDPVIDRLGAAERKIIRDILRSETRFRLLEDIVWNELRHSYRAQLVHRVPFAPGVYGFVIEDRDELSCEVITLTTDTMRRPEHLRYLDDPARLDVLEHRYGMIMSREVLYNGRDARLSSGVSYRNLSKYLLHLSVGNGPQ